MLFVIKLSINMTYMIITKSRKLKLNSATLSIIVLHRSDLFRKDFTILKRFIFLVRQTLMSTI
jgi:hypothetical protein